MSQTLSQQRSSEDPFDTVARQFESNGTSGTCATGDCPAPSGRSGIWVRLGASIVLGGQANLIGLGLNTADVPPVYGTLEYGIAHGLLIGFTLIVMLLLAPPLFRETWNNLRHRVITLDLLFFLSLCGSLTGSLLTTFSGEGSVYYEVIAVVLIIYTLGKMVSAISRERAVAHIQRLRETFNWAKVMDARNEVRRVPVEEILREPDAATLVVAPGEPFTLSGRVLEGMGFVQETMCTGELAPVVKRPGDRIEAGSYSVDGRFLVAPARRPKASAEGEMNKTSLGKAANQAGAAARVVDQIIDAVANAPLSHSGLQDRANQIMRWFVPLVASLSLAAFMGWLAVGSSWQDALFTAMSVLLIACPCAFGIATPVGVWSGMMRLGERGLVVHSGEFIERMAQVDTVIFDKTGTLSENELRVVDFLTTSQYQNQRGRIRAIVAEIERAIDHPIAKALSSGIQSLNTGGPDLNGEAHGSAADHTYGQSVRDSHSWTVKDVNVVAGQGLCARLVEDGRERVVRIGELDFMPAPSQQELASLGPRAIAEEDARRMVFVSIDEQPVGLFVLHEDLRNSVSRLFQHLSAMGLNMRIYTGDRNPQWKSIENCQVEHSLAPEDKAVLIHKLQKDGAKTLYCGDGINDTPALAQAHASIAVSDPGAASLSRSVSQASLPGAVVGLIPDAIGFCRDISWTIRSNLYFALIYNGIGLALAVAGLLHPVVAALIMGGSSALVSFRVLRGVEISLKRNHLACGVSKPSMR